jgi:hypothetical protein
MEVVQIGDVTTGKNVGSVTLYDSPTFEQKTETKSPLCYAANRSKNRQCRRFRRLFQRTKTTYQLKENLGNLDVLGVLLNLY